MSKLGYILILLTSLVMAEEKFWGLVDIEGLRGVKKVVEKKIHEKEFKREFKSVAKVG